MKIINNHDTNPFAEWHEKVGTLPHFAPGSVWLVGAGPGDPALITLMGYHALRAADVIIYDALVSNDILALANPKAECIFAGKRGGKPSPKQSDITDQIIHHAKNNQRVLRLKGGDPFVFGRGAEEATALVRAGIPYRLVPGITSGIAGLAYAGIPLTHRDANSSVLFLTGHSTTGEVPDNIDWHAAAHAAPVIVMYMAVKHAHTITANLIDNGRDPNEPVAIISHATTPKQKLIKGRLFNLPKLAKRAETPAIIVVGKVVNYQKLLQWRG